MIEIHDIEREIRLLLLGKLQAIPSLVVKEDRWTRRKLGDASDPGYVLSLRIGETESSPWQVRVVIKAHAQPRQIHAAAWTLKRNLQASAAEGRIYHLFAAPYISPGAARICEEEGIGYLDLAGNCHLSFGGVHIHVEGKQNIHKEERGLKSLHAPKATRLLRLLLQGPLVGHKVQELAGKAGVSLGLVSKVRTRLLDERLAEDTADGIRITKPDVVLDDWAAADRWEDRTTVREYSTLLSEPAEIASRVHDLLGGKRHAFTQWFGAFLRRPYTLPVVTTVYVSEFPDDGAVKEKLLARRVDSGGRLRLVRPKDEGVFDHVRTLQDLPVVSDVQLYLDLLRAGLRGDEAAVELRKSEDFSGGWK
ncbi:MAG: hypothetical protein K9M97_00150 [Akkermansiaceae bacterium]|nr:hypothetical protein [Akkermansiaceae bacterium]